MKMDWKPDRPCFIDFETQSCADLSTTHKYASHPTTVPLTVCVKIDGTMHRFGPYLKPADKELLARITEGRTLVAHNAPFDAAIWEAAKLPSRPWCDTVPMCRAAGLPGKLEDVCRVLFDEGKDKNGGRLIDMLCIVKNGRIPAIGPAHDLLLDYNEKDVHLLERLFERVRTFGEPAVMTVDRVINDRGIPIDRDHVERLSALYDRNTAESRGHFDEITKDEYGNSVNPGSPKQVLEWLKAKGFQLPNVNKATRAIMEADPKKYFVGDSDLDETFAIVQEAMQWRRDVVRVGKGKTAAALQVLEDDGRVREQHVYWGAHTGRWSGRKLQVHNFPYYSEVANIRELSIEPTYERVKAAAEEATQRMGRRISVTDTLNSLLRSMVRMPALSAVDYGTVEVCGTAWVADDKRMLGLLSDPNRSIYCDLGEKVFGHPISRDDKQKYAFSKSLILGCTYGMSGNKFEWLCRMRNVRTETLAEAGIKIQDAVKLFRTTYPGLPLVWRAYHVAIHSAVGGVPMEAGRCKFYMVRSDLHAELPSGRCIVYRNARIEKRVPGYCKMYNMPEIAVPTVVFDAVRGFTGFLYGSKVCENMVQAICRDLLADALVKAESAGFVPILHVHDEMVCESDRLEELCTMMSDGPAWSAGFPVRVEGYTGQLWTKQTKGLKEIRAINGKILGHV